MQLFRRKGSRYWWCRGRDVDGRRWWESTHQTDHAAAAIAARVLERARLLAPDAATDLIQLSQTERISAIYEDRIG